MPHTRASRALADVRLQLRTGRTRGKKPRPLRAEEVQTLQWKRAALEVEIGRLGRERALARMREIRCIGAHVPQAGIDTEAPPPPQGEARRRTEDALPEIGCGVP